jgi:hypothetical protein
LITHGLQGVAGTGDLYLLLARSVSDPGEDRPEGVSDDELHTLRYAYYPHAGGVQEAQPWEQAYAFNQPLIPVWRAGETILVQLPFEARPLERPFTPGGAALPPSFSLAVLESGVLVDLYPNGEQVRTLVVDYDPGTPPSLTLRDRSLALPAGWLWETAIDRSLLFTGSQNPDGLP